jgi:hypothetical protein
MVNISYVFLILQLSLLALDIFFAFIYATTIVFVRRFHNRNNMFILNICCTTMGSCIYFIIYTKMSYFDNARLVTPQSCAILYYAYSIAGIGIPFTFVTFTVHRFCSIVFHTKPLFKTKKWVMICIASQWIGECIISLPFVLRPGPVSILISREFITLSSY